MNEKRFIWAYRGTMSKIAARKEDKDDVYWKSIREQYRRDLKDRHLEHVNPDYVRDTRRGMLLSGGIGAAGLGAAAYGAYTGNPAPIIAGLAGTGIGGLGVYHSKRDLDRYMADRERRRWRNLQYRYWDRGTNEDLNRLSAMQSDEWR